MVPSRKPPVGFCDVDCCCCFTSLKFFHLLLFAVIPHPSVNYSQVYSYGHLLILYLQPSSSQSDFPRFYFNIFGGFIVPGVLRFWAGVFYPQAFFTLHFFPTFMRIYVWGVNIPLRICLFPKSCFFRLAHGLEPLMFKLQEPCLHDYTTPYVRVHIKINALKISHFVKSANMPKQ